jgi:UDP-4-amino-4,6-dideoxy-N-acetyl-beta-L-altrosamine transaminase
MSALATNLDGLAIHGGTPVRKKLLPYGRQSVDIADIEAVVEVLKSDWLTTGPKVKEFEERFAKRVGARHAVSFSSGTAALHGTAFATGLHAGDEAITTPMTFCATSNCILYQGATPVFADVSSDTLNLDPATVFAKLTSRTKAIFAVDYAGHPVSLDELRSLATKQGALLIEDASHALGATYRGESIGSIADMTVFSFHPVKHLTTGEGGMVTTNDGQMAETLRRFRNHGISSEARERQDAGQWHYEMVMLGFNYRLTDIACALGLSQLEKLDANLARRREIARQYAEAFRDFPVLLPAVSQDVMPAWHLYPIRLQLEQLTAGRAEIFQALRAENIGVNVHYIPVHLHPYYRDRFGYEKGDYPVAEAAYSSLISLPMFHSMTDADVSDVITALAKVLSHYQVRTESKGGQSLLGVKL